MSSHTFWPVLDRPFQSDGILLLNVRTTYICPVRVCSRVQIQCLKEMHFTRKYSNLGVFLRYARRVKILGYLAATASTQWKNHKTALLTENIIMTSVKFNTPSVVW